MDAAASPGVLLAPSPGDLLAAMDGDRPCATAKVPFRVRSVYLGVVAANAPVAGAAAWRLSGDDSVLLGYVPLSTQP